MMKYLHKEGDTKYNAYTTWSLDLTGENALLIHKMQTKRLDIIR